MTPLTFTGDKRLAALRILADDLSLVHTLYAVNAVTDDRTTLTVDLNADTWAYLSSGERTMAGVLEQLADRLSTVTLHDVGRLDEDCRRAVYEAWGLVLHLIFPARAA